MKANLKKLLAEKKYNEVENLWFFAKKMHGTKLEREIYTSMFCFLKQKVDLQNAHQELAFDMHVF